MKVVFPELQNGLALKTEMTQLAVFDSWHYSQPKLSIHPISKPILIVREVLAAHYVWVCISLVWVHINILNLRMK